MMLQNGDLIQRGNVDLSSSLRTAGDKGMNVRTSMQSRSFDRERMRPAFDLLAQIPLSRPSSCVDLWCDSGEGRELLVTKFPDAEVVSATDVDDLVALVHPQVRHANNVHSGVSSRGWPDGIDLIFSSGLMQWVPDHAQSLQRLAALLSQSGCLAVQMPKSLYEPTHVLMRQVASEASWFSKLKDAIVLRTPISPIEDYYGWLCTQFDVVKAWEAVYLHPLEGAAAIVAWMKQTDLREFLDRLDEEESSMFLRRYASEIAAAYPVRNDGKVLLRDRRIFIVASRLSRR